MRPSGRDYMLASLLAVAALAIYIATLTPSLSRLSPDGAELATVPYVLGLAHSPGYPLYTWLGKLFTFLPVGDVAYRMNLMSAVMAAMAVGGVYLIAMQIMPSRMAAPTLRRAGAGLAALLLAFSPTFWSQAVIAEVYAPNLAWAVFSILALLRWERTLRDADFFLFALIWSLSLGMHLSNLGFALGCALFVLLTKWQVLKKPTWWLAALGGTALGLAQFAWLPYKASTLNDPLMLARAPDSLGAIYQYTLGAFPQLKFAFTLSALPDRLVIYLDLLLQQFGLAGILVGIIGLGSLLVRRSRHYYLLLGMYLVNVWFFIQYRAFDLEVFFLPAHLLWSLFIACGAVEVLAGLEALVRLFSAKVAARAMRLGMAGMAVALAFLPLTAHYQSSDRSHDVALNDFYANVWELLPQESVLLTSSGVFGYDAFYWRLAYNTRPDVTLPALQGPSPSLCGYLEQDLYSTNPSPTTAGARQPGALSASFRCSQTGDLWVVPTLMGGDAEGNLPGRGGSLTLYHLISAPPALLFEGPLPGEFTPIDFGPFALLGASLEPETVESGAAVHVTLYWRVKQVARLQVEASLGEQQLGWHEVGLGALMRYQAEVEPLRGRVIEEDFWLVIPSTTPEGTHTFVLAAAGNEASIGEITVCNQEEAMQRWLRIAGKSVSEQ
jgi:hypothetical protein